jgi:hypothetical protein
MPRYTDDAVVSASGQITGNTSTDWVKVQGWVTCSVHFTGGTGTVTWNFRGPDKTERAIVAGSDNITAQAYTATHMVNFFFAAPVEVRGTASGTGSTPVLDWQIFSSSEV